MSRIYEFNPQIYPRRLWISVTKGNKFKDFEDLPEFGEDVNADVNHVKNKRKNLGGLFIRFASVEDINEENITHESVHVALGILEYIGEEVSLKNQEYLSYLAGWVARCCAEVKMMESKSLNPQK